MRDDSIVARSVLGLLLTHLLFIQNSHVALNASEISSQEALNCLIIANVISKHSHLTSSFNLVFLNNLLLLLLFSRALHVLRQNLAVESLVPSSREGMDLANRHEVVYISVGDSSTLLLEVSDEVLQNLDKDSLHFSSQQFAAGVVLSELLKLFVALHEEHQPVVRDINFKVSSQQTVLFNSLPTSR